MVQTHVAASGHFHAVRFYKDSDSLCGIVSDFVSQGFAAHQPAIVIATIAHRAALVRQLQRRGFDTDALQASGQLLLRDAEETLATFMVDGVPNGARFRSAIVPLIQQACAGRPNCVVRAYGEMVDVLWKAGQTTAATRLETLWNDLARTEAFSLLCGYAMGNFYKDSAVEEICSHHSHVVAETGQLAVVS